MLLKFETYLNSILLQLRFERIFTGDLINFIESGLFARNLFMLHLESMSRILHFFFSEYGH